MYYLIQSVFNDSTLAAGRHRDRTFELQLGKEDDP
jgi:hypothetical protein